MKTLRIAIAQINTTVGDIEGNSRRILEYAGKAKNLQADVVVFPELAVCGYPPEDLLLKPSFVSENLRAINQLAKKINGIAAIVGFADRGKAGLYNAAAVISGGKIKGFYRKMRLPNYSVFDEKRYFNDGKEPFLFRLGEVCCGVNICEDVWHSDGPAKIEAESGAVVIFVVNASPYYAEKIKQRQEVLTRQAKANRVAIVYANLTGGQDELVFDGQSFIVGAEGKILAMAKPFEEDLLVADINLPRKQVCKNAIPLGNIIRPKTISIPPRKKESLSALDEIYRALKLGLGDYIHKNGFRKVVIGLSGGIDSALTAAIAKDALGRENVIGVFMPSRFTSAASREGALKLAKNLGIKFITISIDSVFNSYLKDLEAVFRGYPGNIAEENLQARVRGNILMALSNKFGHIVLATGNKSEVSCGYCTLYGDMAGGFSVIKDVPKTLVYKLAKFVNRDKEIIPRHTLTRPPTAELKPNQKDTDTLPPYAVLDPIIKAYVEEDKSLEEIIKKTNQRALVSKVIRMIDSSEYKRRQASPGIKITPKAFGKDRRMPITNKFNEK